MNRTEKQALIDTLRSDLEPDGHLVLAEYRGLTVEQMSQLRRQVREVAGSVRVMKNTLVSRAMIADALGHGLDPLWETTEDNTPSRRLAARLGYRERERYPVYAVELPRPACGGC